jgi:polysaccharide pyruvyl transferase WcaK-like protein
VAAALNAQAAVSIARDHATMEYLRAIGVDRARLGACPTLFLDRFPVLRPQLNGAAGGPLIAIRHPSLMNLPLRHQARLHDAVRDIAGALDKVGFESARILCHDMRDASFAASLGDMEFVMPEDAYTLVELLRRAPLVVTFRLHAFVPCVSLGTPAINISYDERSRSLLRTIGLDRWDIDFVGTPDVAGAVRDRAARLGDLDELRSAAQPIWRGYEQVQRDSAAEFAACVRRYATSWSPVDG